jgi:hypothetical protein
MPGEVALIERLIDQGETHTHQALLTEQLSCCSTQRVASAFRWAWAPAP